MFNNPFSMVVAIVGLVMIAKVLTAWLHNRQHGITQQPDPEAQRLRDEVKALKDRVAVLERLATDDSSALEREFEKLRGRD